MEFTNDVDLCSIDVWNTSFSFEECRDFRPLAAGEYCGTCPLHHPRGSRAASNLLETRSYIPPGNNKAILAVITILASIYTYYCEMQRVVASADTSLSTITYRAYLNLKIGRSSSKLSYDGYTCGYMILAVTRITAQSIFFLI